MNPSFSIIAAVSQNNFIGKDNSLPWRAPEDLRWFKQKTANKCVIMGRKTFDSIGRVLPKRANIIITRQPGLKISGAYIAGSIEKAIEQSKEILAKNKMDPEVMIIGGGKIYADTLPIVNKLYLTKVHIDVDGDTEFPIINELNWNKIYHEDFYDSEPHLSFQIFEKNI